MRFFMSPSRVLVVKVIQSSFFLHPIQIMQDLISWLSSISTLTLATSWSRIHVSSAALTTTAAIAFHSEESRGQKRKSRLTKWRTNAWLSGQSWIEEIHQIPVSINDSIDLIRIASTLFCSSVGRCSSVLGLIVVVFAKLITPLDDVFGLWHYG